MGVETLIPVATSLFGAGMSYLSGKDQAKSQEDAAQRAEQAAKKQADQADQQMNRANAKRPDVAAMLSANEQAAKGGISGTMLTGPSGVDPRALQLGKNSLLGG